MKCIQLGSLFYHKFALEAEIPFITEIQKLVSSAGNGEINSEVKLTAVIGWYDNPKGRGVYA